MTEVYQDLIKDVSAQIAKAFLSHESNLEERSLFLDADVASITRQVGLESMRLIYTTLLNQNVTEEESKGLHVHRNPTILFNVLFGVLELPSPYLWNKDSHSKPLLDVLNLSHHGRSEPVTRALSDFGSENSFDQASNSFAEHYKYHLSSSTVRRVTERTAEEALSYIEQKLSSAIADYEQDLAKNVSASVEKESVDHFLSTEKSAIKKNQLLEEEVLVEEPVERKVGKKLVTGNQEPNAGTILPNGNQESNVGKILLNGDQKPTIGKILLSGNQESNVGKISLNNSQNGDQEPNRKILVNSNQESQSGKILLNDNQESNVRKILMNSNQKSNGKILLNSKQEPNAGKILLNGNQGTNVGKILVNSNQEPNGKILLNDNQELNGKILLNSNQEPNAGKILLNGNQESNVGKILLNSNQEPNGKILLNGNQEPNGKILLNNNQEATSGKILVNPLEVKRIRVNDRQQSETLSQRKVEKTMASEETEKTPSPQEELSKIMKCVELMLIEMDGCNIRTAVLEPVKNSSETTPIRKLPKKHKKIKWRDVRIGFARPMDSKSKTYVGKMDSYSEVAKQLFSASILAGMSPQTEIVGVADGGPGLKEALEKQFENIQFILDKTHLKDHLYDTAEALGISGNERREWVKSHLKAISEGKVEQIKKEFENEYEQNDNDRLRQLIGYLSRFSNNVHYDKFKEKGYPVGSGEVESAHKYIPQRRLKLPGASWDPNNVEPMLALRLLKANKWWDDFWKTREKSKIKA